MSNLRAIFRLAMSILIKIIHSLLSYILVGIVGLIFGLPILIILLLPERIRYNSRFYAWCTHQFFYWTLMATLLPITFIGTSNIPKNTPVIFAANHQSSLDVPLVGVLAKGQPSVWLAWSQLVNYPVLGFILKRVAVLVDASTPTRAARSLLEAIDRIKNNQHHVMIFPEGGRYTDGKVHDFFSGFVILARRTGRSVVPVYIKGASKAYPPHAWLANWYPVQVVIGSPFMVHESETDEAFKQRVHDWFVEQQEK